MQIIDARKFSFVQEAEWLKELEQRPSLPAADLESSVIAILNDVRERGDAAIHHYSRVFDKTDLKQLETDELETMEGLQQVPTDLKSAIDQAVSNIELFHKAQIAAVNRIETMPGIFCWRKSVPIERIGLYIPGGTAPLFSTVLMLGIPARLAGCRQVVLCTPPGRDGKLHPAILYAASKVGITQVIKAGGVQAIGGMAYGTATIPKVDKIFGPGNQYVTCAKQFIQKEGVAIDMPAGPSELAVFADQSAEPEFIAADLLSQAEHGADSQVILVCLSSSMAEAVRQALSVQLDSLPRKAIAGSALENSKTIIVNDRSEAIQVLNRYAPEHLILACENPEELADLVINAGSVFLGHYAPESLGDFASGTNHCLPTHGYARAYGGVSLDSFVKKITFQYCTRSGLGGIGKTVQTMAKAEGLEAHARAVGIREKN